MIGLCLIVGVCGWLWLGRSYIEAMRPVVNHNNDYFQDWASARNYWDGLAIYTPHSTTIPRYQGRPPSEPERGLEYNAHPPTSVVLALPLGRLDYSDAVVAWNVVSIVALAVSLVIVAAAMPELRKLFLPVAALLPFCLPIYGNLQQGQLTLVLLLFVTAAWALDRSGRPEAAGVLIGAAATVKLFPAYLVLPLVARGRWQALLAAAVSAVAVSLATAALLGRATYDDYLHTVLPYLQVFPTLGYNASFAGFWNKLFNPAGEGGVVVPLWPSPATARWGTLFCDAVVTAIVAMLAYRAKTPAGRDLAFGTAVTAMLLVSPVTWDISMVLLLVPLALLARTAEKSRWIPFVLVLVLVLLCIPQKQLTVLALAGRTVRVVSPGFMLGAPSLKFYALLATFMLGVAAFRIEERAAAVNRRELGSQTDGVTDNGNAVSAKTCRWQRGRPHALVP